MFGVGSSTDETVNSLQSDDDYEEATEEDINTLSRFLGGGMF